jgi:hypothetical protein
MVHRVTTLSSSAISSSTVTLRSGKASKKVETNCLGLSRSLGCLDRVRARRNQGIELVDEVWVVLVGDLPRTPC